MSAETLRKAAALIRERAEAATNDGYPWISRPHFSRRNCQTVQTRGQVYVAHYVTDADGEHIASWHPAVALAVAEWLDATARESEIESDDPRLRNFFTFGDTAPEVAALAVARAYLGGDA